MKTRAILPHSLLMIIFAGILLLPDLLSSTYAAQLIQKTEEKILTIFYTQKDEKGWKAVLKGQVLNLGMREISDKDLRQFSQDKTKVTVRLYNQDGILKNDSLYIIDNSNVIIAKLEVQKIFKSKSFGYLLIGYGNFRQVQPNNRVVQRKEEENARFAYIHKARGDYFRESGDIAQASLYYEKAITLDKQYAEAHTALGYIYLEKRIIPFAIKEFNKAYQTFGRIYDNEDKFLLLKGLTITRYLTAFESDLPAGHKIRNRNIKEGITYTKKALKYKPASVRLNFYLGMFYYRNSLYTDDMKAKDQMLKVIEYQHDHIEALIVLARLYYKHRNKEKAREYIKKAMQYKPNHPGVQDTYKKITQYN